jgi:hypothetical protein
MTSIPPLYTSIPILWGDNLHNDRAVIARLLFGGEAFDMRTQIMIEAPTLRELPAGVYRTVPDPYRTLFT